MSDEPTTLADLRNQLQEMGQFALADNLAKRALMDRRNPHGPVARAIDRLLEDMAVELAEEFRRELGE